MQLERFDAAAFLRDTWQRKPLLIRNPWKDWHNPLDPDELAGLACEDAVESRLVTMSDKGYALENGPLAEDRFATLGTRDWTLLVQSVDHHVPAVAELIEPFRFVPDWRLDDVMVSYAADGGGVGPHFDNYDVFLVQGLGRRRWQLGARCDDATPLLPHDDLRLLAEFEPVEEWVLEPGDMLYVPPGIAHNGVAVGDDCMTYSIGFRAPSEYDLIEGWTDDILDGLGEDRRYADPGLPLQPNPGEITEEALSRLHETVTRKLADRAAFVRWFGRYNSAPKNPEIEWGPENPVSTEEVRKAIDAGVAIVRNPASRFSFVAGTNGDVLLFADGECFECAGDSALFAKALCAQVRFVPDSGLARNDDALRRIARLCTSGSIAFAG
ncbi:cupin domain-containing protein [Novosphingobium sp. ZN18A2]|uniref:cupin domain-containing protein n=1 Tax=Novosphingobium sp. ZN18A2 TaxID=3079861 RepID=UPI0030CF9855